MNDVLQKSLAEIITQASAGMSAGIGFLKEEIPDVVQQFLLWKMSWAVVVFIASLAVAITAAMIVKKCLNAARQADIEYMTAVDDEVSGRYKAKLQVAEDRKNFWGFPGAFLIIVLTVVGICFLFIAFFQLHPIFQIWLAPKIYLIEYAATILK